MKTLTLRSRRAAAGLLAGAALAAGITAAQAAPNGASKTDLPLHQTLGTGRQSGWSAVIITTTGNMTAQDQSALKTLGADITRRLPFIHAVAACVPTRNLGKVAALPFVSHLSSDGLVKKSDEFTVGSSGAGYAYANYGLTGQGVTVAIVDSGVDHCTDLSNVVADQDFVNGAPNFVYNTMTGTYDRIYDPCGHGTHVAGIMAGNGTASAGKGCYRTFYGTARSAGLVDVRVLDQNGQGTVSTVISGLQWVVANKSAYNIRVVNLSLGHPVGESYTTDPLCQAVEAAYKAGIVVVCAAGNNGRASSTNTAGLDNEGWGTNYGSIASPGNDPYVITVGATKKDPTTVTGSNYAGIRSKDKIATYSSRGPSRLDLILKPDLVAPGNQIISLEAESATLYSKYAPNNDLPDPAYFYTAKAKSSNKYFKLSGTSMASPVVAGAVALLLQANPSLSPDTIKVRLMMSADKMPNWVDASGNYDACTYGAGYVNIPAALNCTAVAGQAAMSPDLFTDSSGNCYINLDSALWGTYAIWGTNITDLHAIWGTGALWGSNTLASSHAIWGTSVWSDHAIWGTSTDAVDLSSIAINGDDFPATSTSGTIITRGNKPPTKK